MKKILSLVLALMMVLSLASFAGAETVTEIPREETLYFCGQQYGAPNSWNPIGSNQNNAMACTASASGSRTLMFETLYMYNVLDGSMTPLLADGDYIVSDDMADWTINLKAAAKWSDGTPVTAEDVKKTFDTCVYLQNTDGVTYGPYIDSIEVVSDKQLIIHAAKNEEGIVKNALIIKDFLVGTFVAQKAWIETLEARCNNDVTAMLTDEALDVVWSGPYTRLIGDDTRVILIRDDNYWGQDESMWGKLPAPKYIGHANYSGNDTSLIALKAGEVDVSQQFISNVQDLWEKEELPISTYLEEAPYGVCLNMPTAWYNMNIPVIAENPALRKAIAIAVDYDSIIANAMTNQSPSFSDVPRSIFNPTDGEQALYDHDAVASLQWAGNDIEGAKAMLDEAGIVDTDGDGWREYNGEKISLNACCPNGWTDWQAAMEIVAAAGQNIGIEITTLYPEWSIYQTVFTQPNQTEYCIFMYSSESASPSNPWKRARQFMSSELLGIENNWTGNYGQYKNEEATEIINKIPTITDEAELKSLYTRLVEIYLTEVPSFSLMYRPSVFYAVNETYWTNYPENGDGQNIPPTDCTDGYGIAALYVITPVEQ